MKVAFLDIPVIGLLLFFLISSLFSIDRWASFAGSFGVWHNGFLVFFLQVLWYFFAARFVKLDTIWRLGFILPILFMLGLGVLAKSFAVALLGLAALLFFHIARRKSLMGLQGIEILLIALFFALLGLLGAFPIATLVPLRDSLADLMSSWTIAFSSLFESPKNFFFGTGPATFSLDMARYGSPIIPSGFSQILATLGVIGFLLYLLVFALAFLRFASLVFHKLNRMQGFFAASLFAVFCAYLLGPAVLPVSLVFWTLASFARDPSINSGLVIPNIAKRLTKLGTLVLAGFVIFMGFRVIGAQVVYQKATREPNLAKRISFFKTAQKINPYEPTYKIELAELYIGQAKKEAQQDKPSPEAVQAIENALLELGEAVKTGPARSEAWEALGMLYKEIQGAPGAKEWGVKAFETAIVLSPKNARLYTELGTLYTQEKEFDLADSQFKKALSLSPNFLDALMALALLEEKKGNTDIALSILEKVSLQNPSHGASLFQLGRVYYNKGRLLEAETAFKQVLKISPSDSNAHYSLGLLYEKEKRKKEAIEEFQKVLELNLGDSIVIMKLNQLKK